MLSRLSSLFQKPPVAVFDEADLRHFVQQYLQAQVRSSEVFCEQVGSGAVMIRVTNPALQQDIQLREWEVRQKLAEVNIELKKFRVYI